MLLLRTLALLSALGPANPPAECEGVPTTRAARAVANDNRVAAGTMKDGILTLRLVARQAAWHPDGASGCGLRVNAFAEEGKPARIPGPLIRVPVGTDVHIILRNALDDAVRIRGLLERPIGWLTLTSGQAQIAMDSTAVEIAKGDTREIRFRANVPGNFYYWGIRSATDTVRPTGRLRPDLATTDDGQLVGALIVDPVGGSPPDRIIVLTHTRVAGAPSIEDPARAREVNAINGLSWPHSERVSASVGDTLRWRVLNPAATSHTMHLHGFYFRILARGFVSAYDSVLPPSRQETVVSEFMPPNRTMTMEWVPERPGNWLFHCHFLIHMSPAQRVDRVFDPATAARNARHDDHGVDAMAGPIVGITVRASRGRAAPASVPPRRVLRLFANERPRVFGELPGMGFVLQSGDTPPAPDSIRIPGSPLILTRGEPTQITVVNRLRVGLGVHWHGIELESYFDGVPGVSGAPGRLMSAIQPGDSFAVHMTPPRAGTFIYHVHSEQSDELNSGLYGSLIVLEPGRGWDPETDHVFVLSNGGPGDSFETIFINGSATPAAIEMRRGVPNRLRFISIPANGEFVVRVLDASNNEVAWRQIARDGADLPADAIRRMPARTRVDVGITKDFELTPDQPGALVLEVDHRRPGHPTRLTINVR
jgi:FtsP/CotA-like multicopper oxidase with cupredoxin domain